MKISFSILILLSLIPAVFSQSTVVPIVIGEDLIGGAQNGKWLTAKQTEAQFVDKTEFKLIGFTEINIGIFVGTKADRGVCEDARITFTRLYEDVEVENNKLPLYIGTFADWEPLPRLPKKIGLTNNANQKIVADFLKTKRITKTKIKITQAFQIDLDGDGKQEIIIAASYYKREIIEEQSVGDYSFVLLRKVVKGKWQNILISGEFFTKSFMQSGEYGPPNSHKITALADLNGDGKMEIVMRSYYYEGHWNAVFELSKNKLTKVLEVECGL
jgi:hypothetical protein